MNQENFERELREWEQRSEKSKRIAERITLVASIIAIILSVSVIVWKLSR